MVNGVLGGCVVGDATAVATRVALVAVVARPVVGDVVVVTRHRDEGDAGVAEAAHDGLEVVVVVLAVAVHIAEAHHEVGRGHVVGRCGEDDALAARAPHAADVIDIGLHLLDAGAVVASEGQMGVGEDDDGEIVLRAECEAGSEGEEEGG